MCPAATEILAPVPDAILNQFAPEGMLTAAEVEAATRRCKKALLERALGAELGHHLAQEGEAAPAEAPANHRNGSSGKTVRTDAGALPLAIPRDRHGTCAPVLIPKHQRRFTGFDDTSVAWQARPLEPMSPVVFFDALRVKMRDEGVVQSKAVSLALAILPDGHRDLLGLWVEQPEGAKFWRTVFAGGTPAWCISFAAADAAEAALTAVEAGPWGRRFPTVMTARRRAWNT